MHAVMNTMKKLRKNIKKYYRELIIRIVDFLAKTTSSHTPNTQPALLLFRHDAIGDYVLFRNYLPYLKTHPTYKTYKIVLVGNSLWQDLAIQLDSSYIDEFIFIDTNRFVKSIFYRYKMAKKIYAQKYDEFVYPIYAREYQAEHILAGLSVKNATAYNTPPPDYATWQRKKMNTLYTKLIPPPDVFLFEGIKNQHFFSQWLESDIPVLKPEISLDSVEVKIELPERPYVVLFPSASTSKKRWSTRHFASVAEYILKKYPDYHIVIAGSKKDNVYAQEIMNLCNASDKIQNYTSKTNLIQLAHLIRQATLLISNDTVAVHIAAAVQCPFICIAMGQDKGKFIPYPESFNVSTTCLFSIELTQSYNINDIPADRVTENLHHYLS